MVLIVTRIATAKTTVLVTLILENVYVLRVGKGMIVVYLVIKAFMDWGVNKLVPCSQRVVEIKLAIT